MQLNATDVVIVHPEGTDPLTLVEEAIKLKKERKEDAKTGNAIPYDEVWVVFDLEKPHDERRIKAKEAFSTGRSENIKFGDSDPCFEFWLLLHEVYTTAQFKDCDSVIKRLKKYWPDYSKGERPSEEFLKKLPAAVDRANRCRKHHAESGGDGNPGTNLDKLAILLNQATRLHLRLF